MWENNKSTSLDHSFPVKYSQMVPGYWSFQGLSVFLLDVDPRSSQCNYLQSSLRLWPTHLIPTAPHQILPLLIWNSGKIFSSTPAARLSEINEENYFTMQMIPLNLYVFNKTGSKILLKICLLISSWINGQANYQLPYFKHISKLQFTHTKLSIVIVFS